MKLWIGIKRSCSFAELAKTTIKEDESSGRYPDNVTGANVAKVCEKLL